MTITEREYQSLKETIERNHQAMINMLEMRKEYFDKQFNEMCNYIKEMKNHCSHTQDQCAIVFKEHEKRIQGNSDDIIKIKTIGGVLGVLWALVVPVANHIVRKVWG